MIGRADVKNRSAVLTWDQINRYARNMGNDDFNYDTFKIAYDSDPLTQGLVNRFDKNGVELNTKAGNNDVAPSDATADRNTVSTAAKRATNKARG